MHLGLNKLILASSARIENKILIKSFNVFLLYPIPLIVSHSAGVGQIENPLFEVTLLRGLSIYKRGT